ncbi:MAG: hypothetical protein LBB12_03100 [Holosporaceae bacterium]|nr:hypothetical protein [Holosporaceae bacterium]
MKFLDKILSYALRCIIICVTQFVYGIAVDGAENSTTEQVDPDSITSPRTVSPGIAKFQDVTAKVMRAISTSPEQNFSNDDFSELIKKIFSVRISHSDLPDNPESDGVTAELANAITEYHSIPKTVYESLPRRSFALFCICRMCLQQSHVLQKKGLSTKNIDKIFEQAAAKHNYIVQLTRKLAVLNKERPKGQKIDAFVEFFNTYFISNEVGKARTKIMTDLDCYMEALDPYLRGNSNSSGIFLNPDYVRWRKLVEGGKTNLGFFMWLEGLGKRSVRYEKSSNLVLEPLTGIITEISPNNYSNILKLPTGCYDFVVTKNGKFYFSPSEIGVKHIGLSQGKPVAFAGEISISQGKIVVINNHSGHFRPSTDFVLFVLDVLKKANCINGGYFALSFNNLYDIKNPGDELLFTYYADQEFPKSGKNIYENNSVSSKDLETLIQDGALTGEVYITKTDDDMFYISSINKYYSFESDCSRLFARYPNGKSRKYTVQVVIENKKIIEINNILPNELAVYFPELQLAYKDFQSYNLVPAGKEPTKIVNKKSKQNGISEFAYRF